MIFAYIVLSVLAAYTVVMSLIQASLTGKTPPPSTSGTAVFAMAWYLWSVIGLWVVIHTESLTGSAWVVAALLGVLYTYRVGRVVNAVGKPHDQMTGSVVMTALSLNLVELGALALLFPAVH
jgi:hypothetical protein